MINGYIVRSNEFIIMEFQIKSLNEYNQKHKESIEQPELFWGDIANQFTWHKKWDHVLEWDFSKPEVKW